jgi:uncharacterized protein YukE
MSHGFEVDPDEVDAHAGTVDGFATRADTAVDAGAHVARLDDAYGLFCRPFGTLLAEPQQRGVDTLTETAAQLHEMTDKLRESAKTYRETEETIAEFIERLLELLEQVNDIPIVRGGN